MTERIKTNDISLRDGLIYLLMELKQTQKRFMANTSIGQMSERQFQQTYDKLFNHHFEFILGMLGSSNISEIADSFRLSREYVYNIHDKVKKQLTKQKWN